MATLIRAEISEKNKYWIDKHRHYELKHFCLQYPIWKKAYRDIEIGASTSRFEREPSGNIPGDVTSRVAVDMAYYSERIKLIESAALETDESLYLYILKAVTEGLSFAHLKSKFGIPCGKDLYYDRYRRFFWLLSNSRR